MHIQGQRIFMLVYATGLLQNKLNEDGEKCSYCRLWCYDVNNYMQLVIYICIVLL